jgi:chemotaxis signal transduction protein
MSETLQNVITIVAIASLSMFVAFTVKIITDIIRIDRQQFQEYKNQFLK